MPRQKTTFPEFFQGALRGWSVLLPLLLIIPALPAFPYPSAQALYSDAAISHYPNAVYLRQALLEWHSLPLWSPTILSGFPFAANPLASLFYPPAWLSVLLPLPLGFNLLVMAHLLWAGIGMYALLRVEGLSHYAALLGALAFEALPKLFAHYGAGHLTLIYAVSWTPWLLVTSRIEQRRWGGWVAALPSLVFALILMADARWAMYSGLLWWAYVLWSDISSRKQAVHSLGRLLGWTLLAGLLAAPLLLPLAEYAAHSTRANLSVQEVFTYSLPPARLLGLVFPELGGPHEWTIYSGAVILAFTLLALAWRSCRRAAAFWAGAAIVSLVLAMGEHLPLLPLIAKIPLVDLLRVPARALFITGMALAALAGIALQACLSGLEKSDLRRGRLLLAGLICFTLLMSALFFWLTQPLPPGIIWGCLFAVASAVWIMAGLSVRLPHRVWILGIFALCLIDLLGVDAASFEPRSAETVLASGAEAAAYLKSQPGDFRTYSPSYSLPQQRAVVDGLRLADGVDPLQLQTYVEFMEHASGVPVEGYSVTVPPFANGDPATANKQYVPYARLLGMLNVAYVLAEFDLDALGLAPLRQIGETRVYANQHLRPPAWIEPEDERLGIPVRTASLVSWEPNRIEVAAAGPGALVLSEIAYPGWKAWMDGEPVPMLTRYELLRSVDLPAGSHRVVFEFQPWTLIIGLAAALLGWAVVLPAVYWRARQ
jgi:hypothetical protein